MKNNYKYILFYILMFYVSTNYGQNTIDSKKNLETNINIAFENLEKTDSLYFDPTIKDEFIQDYLEYFGDISPEQFNSKNKAESWITYYSNPKGIKELILEFNKKMDGDFDEIFSIGMDAYMKVYFNSDNPGAMMLPNVLNKYALLLPKVEPTDENVAIYLNSNYICLVKQAKNGIRVHSGKEYVIEFKLNNTINCSDKHIFIKQEQKVINCEIN